jgi:hypothetical protein
MRPSRGDDPHYCVVTIVTNGWTIREDGLLELFGGRLVRVESVAKEIVDTPEFTNMHDVYLVDRRFEKKC